MGMSESKTFTAGGWLIKSTINGAGHGQLLERSSYNWWFVNYSGQLRSETFGYETCRAAKMVAKYKKLRPRCSSESYREPIWGEFQ
jgi:hypothetical protein